MASIEGTKLFLGELDKVQKRLNDAVRSSNDIAREKFNLDMSLAQQGLFSRTDPNTGQQFIEKLSPEQNTILQGKIANMDAISTAQQDISIRLRRNQLVADLDLTKSAPAKELRETKRGIKRKDEISKVQTEAEILASPEGQFVEQVKIDRTGEVSKARAKGTKLGELEAVADPTFRKAKKANDILKLAEQKSQLNILKRMNKNLDVSAIEEELEKGNLVDKGTLASLTNQAIIRNATNARVQDRVDRLLVDLQAIAVDAGIPPEKIPLGRDSSPDVIESVIRNLLTVKPKGVSLPEFNKFNDNVAEVSRTFDDLRAVQLFVRQVKGKSFDQDVPPKILSLFPEIFEDDKAIDDDDDEFELLQAELARLQSEYTVLANSLEERSKRNPEFEEKFRGLVKNGIIIGKKGK